MKKVISILVAFIIIVAILLIAPYFVGQQAQKDYQATVTQLNDREIWIQATPISYQRGWFHSQATTRLTFHPEKLNPKLSDQKLPSIVLNTTFAHGPIAWLAGRPSLTSVSSVTQIDKSSLPARQQQLLTELFGKQQSVSLFTWIGFTGNKVFKLDIPSANYHQQGVNLKSAPLALNIQLKKNNQHFDANMHWPGLQAVVLGFDVSLSDVQLDYKSKRFLTHLWLANGQLKAKNLQVQTKQSAKPLLKANDLDLQTWKGIENNKLDFGLGFTLNQLTYTDQAYGPADIKLTLTSNVDATTLDKLVAAESQEPLAQRQEEMETLAKGGILALKTPSNIRKLSKAMFDQGFAVQLKPMKLQTPWGQVVGDLEYDLKPGNNFEPFVTHKNPLALFAHSAGQFQLTLPKSLANSPSLGPQLMALVQSGFLMSEQENYVIKGQLDEQKFTINGKQIPLPSAKRK
jgi:uncharacterized protein YdgA (DUF945 family)